MDESKIMRDRILLKSHVKIDFLIWKYSGHISECPQPQLLLECFQRDLDEIKEILRGKNGHR